MSGKRTQTSTTSNDPDELPCYVESSALLAALLEQDIGALSILRRPGPKITSALTFAESYRGILRAATEGRLTTSQERSAIRALQTFERRCTVVEITATILTRSSRPFPVEPVRTLEAIHLATAELMTDHPQLVTFLTRDRRVKENAQRIGYMVA